MAQIVFIVVAAWIGLLALGPLVGFTSDLARALLVAGLVGWITAWTVPEKLRRYRPAPRSATPLPRSLQDGSASAGSTQRRSVRVAAGQALTNLSLLLASCLLGFFLCEIFLRQFYPKYQSAAEAQYDYDAIRVWSTGANQRGRERHPDTGLYYPYYHNNLGMRQHRDFSEENLDSATNISFLGDSFVENRRMESQYSFTEPLDYILGLGQERFNILNLGVDGYGTGQSFLRYENFRYAKNLNYVFYVYIPNDLRNIYEMNLFYLDEVGALVRNEAIWSPWWVRIVSGLHTSYLLLEVGQQFPFVARDIFSHMEEYLVGKMSASAKEHLRVEHRERYHSPIADGIEHDFTEGRMNSEDVENSVIIFQQLILLWKELAEEYGGKFYIVLLPIVKGELSHSALRSMIASIPTIPGGEIDVINLYECFNDYVKGLDQREWRYQPYRFKNDGHWNEGGNQLATVCLYRFLEQELGLPVQSDESLREALFTYYSSFEGWMPDERWIKEVPVPPHVRDSIRDKYLALEKDRPGAD